MTSLAAFSIGPWAVQLLFGTEFDLSRRTLGLLALGSALYMLAVAIAQAVIALHGHARQAFVWLLGVVVFVAVVVLMSDYDLFLRAEVGLLHHRADAILPVPLPDDGHLRGDAPRAQD